MYGKKTNGDFPQFLQYYTREFTVNRVNKILKRDPHASFFNRFNREKRKKSSEKRLFFVYVFFCHNNNNFVRKTYDK